MLPCFFVLAYLNRPVSNLVCPLLVSLFIHSLPSLLPLFLISYLLPFLPLCFNLDIHVYTVQTGTQCDCMNNVNNLSTTQQIKRHNFFLKKEF